jgi:hypothetical protein
VSINVDDFTVPEKILLAAETLDKQGQSPFSAETLIVESWKRFPRTFGLKGYVEHHPDSNKILSSIMGEKGLVRRGWLVKMGQKMYSLTQDGRRVVRRITQDDEPLPSNLVKVSRDQEHFLLRLLESGAWEKFEQNRKAELTFADACRFWGVTENMKGDALDERIGQFNHQLAEPERLFADGDGPLSNGRHVDAGEVRVLTNIHRYMEDRFDRHLNLLKSRTRK